MVTTYYPPYSFGGDGVFIFNLADALALRGHSVDVVHCLDSYHLAHRGAPTSAPLNRPGVRVFPLRSPFGIISPLMAQQTGTSLLKNRELRGLLESNYDVIHYHNISLIGLQALTYGKAIKLYTPHDYWLICPTHNLFKFNQRVCEGKECIGCLLSYRRPPQWWRATGSLESALTNIDVFLPPSLSCMERLRREGVRGRMVHLPEFVPSDFAEEDLARFGLPGKSGFFLFAGRLEKLKGAHTLIPLFRDQSNYRLVIAGTGSQEQPLRALARDSPAIQFLGNVSRGALRELYRRATALLVPSLCEETFSLVTVEAFQNRTPVIARNLGGPAELIRESGGGLTYTSDEQLTEAMHRLSADRTFRDELGHSAYAAYQRNWTESRHIARYLSIIDDLNQDKTASVELAGMAR